MFTRVEKLIEQVESGVPIDCEKEHRLIMLEFVRIGDQFANEVLERGRAHDDRLERHAIDS